jgi:Na+/H+ antiporter NhaD/arsenite permease-like protein
MTTPIIIFCIAFLLIVFEIFDKSIISLCGALAMVLFRVLTPDEAIHAIDFKTILLLMAMMILVEIASKSNIFIWLNTKIVVLTQGSPFWIFVLFCMVTAFFSAFLDNVTTVILIVPMTIQLVKGMGRDPRPFILGEILSSNVGGALTLIGDPPNIIIGGATGFGFLDFLRALWIPVGASLIFTVICLLIIFWSKLKPIRRDMVELYISQMLIESIRLRFLKTTLEPDFIIRVLTILILTVLGFLAEEWTHIPTFITALTGAMLLELLTSNRVSLSEALEGVEWNTLFFFSGLFIMVGGIEKTGVLEQLGTSIAGSTQDPYILLLLILWVSGFVSMILDNIPFVTVMLPVITTVQTKFTGTQMDPHLLWWSLSLGACLGGNATLIGASANVVSVGLAEKEGVKIGFLDYAKVAFPVTVGVLGLCSLYLYWRAV